MKLIIIMYAITFIPSWLIARGLEKRGLITSDYLVKFLKTWFWSPIGIPTCLYRAIKDRKK